MKVLVEYQEDFGRMGDLEGLFVCEKSDLDSVMGEEVEFGEVLGKHSEIYGEITDETCKIKSEDQEFIAKLVELIGHETISGYNPVARRLEQREEEGP